MVISGSLGEEINQLYSMGVSGMEASVCNIISLNNAMDNAEKYLCYAAERVLRVLKTGMELVQNEKYKGIIFDSAGLGEASKYGKTTYKLNNFKEILDIV